MPSKESKLRAALEDVKTDDIARLRDDLRLARERAYAAEKRMHDAERIRESVFGLASTAITPPTWSLRRGKPSDSQHAAVLLVSDFQYGEVINKENMDGINEYSVPIADARYRRLIERTIDISQTHLQANRYAGIFYLRLGDMVSGDIHQELRETNELGGVTSLPPLVALESWGIQQLADAFGKVHVISVPGNHGRTTLKPPTKRIEENFDWLLACWLETRFAGDARITWQTPRSTDAVFEIFGRKYLATHGDNIGARGGQGFIGPAATVMRGFKKTHDEYSRRGEVLDAIFCGHFHTALDVGLGWCNGSLSGYSEFARSNRMTPEPAQQWLIMFHPKWGSTSQWKVRVG